MGQDDSLVDDREDARNHHTFLPNIGYFCSEAAARSHTQMPRERTRKTNEKT